MAEETIVELLVPEKIEFDVKVNSNRAGYSSDTDNGVKTLRRTSSIGSDSNLDSSRKILNSPKITPKPIPNYLRASTGTCHDFCKYGRRRALEEEKTKRPFRKLQKSFPNKLNSAQISVSVEEKEKLVKHKSSLDTNGRSRNSKPSLIKSRSPDRKPSLDIKTNLSTSRVEKVKVDKQKSSIDTNNRLPAQPSFIKPRLSDRKLSLDSKTNLLTSKVEKSKVVKQKSSIDTNEHLLDSKSSFIKPRSPDRKFFNDRRTSFPLSKVEKSKGVRQKSSEDTDKHSPDQNLSLDSKTNFPTSKVEKSKVVKQKSSMDTNKRLLDSKSSFIKRHSPDRKFSNDRRTSFPLSKVEKSKGVRQKCSEDTNKHSADQNLSTESKSCLPKLRTSLDAKKCSEDTSKHSPDQNLSTESKSSFPKHRTSLDAKTHRPKQNGTSDDKSLPTEKTVSSDHSEIIKTEICLPSQTDVPKKKTVTGGKMLKTEERKYSSPSIKLKPVKVNASSSGNSDATDVKTELNRGLKSTRKIKTIASGRKGFALSTATFSPRVSLKVKKSASPLNNQNKIQRAGTRMTEIEKDPEKTLHVIKTDTENNALALESETKPNEIKVAPSVPSSLSQASSSNGNSSCLSHEQDDQEMEHSASESDGCSPDEKETLEIREIQSVEENKNKFVRRNKAIASEVKYRSPVKLKFRSGKVVDLHTDNTTTTPRRLRFRKARILSADQVKGIEFTRRMFKKPGSDNGANNGNSSVKVSLKHQDVLGKKDERGLFNNVIEETASKLVGTRKSKVLALVGAFETVISLQESKPSAHAAN